MREARDVGQDENQIVAAMTRAELRHLMALSGAMQWGLVHGTLPPVSPRRPLLDTLGTGYAA